MLTPSIAQDIARETGQAIGFNVLITDPDGVVLGSGDPARVGSFHEASVDVVHTLRPAAHTTAEANRLTGVLPGVTLPILLDGDPVGTVGITGSPTRVRRFGRVVRSQTEVLLRESLLLCSESLQDRAVEMVIRDIAHFDPELIDARLIARRARELGYDLRRPRAAVVIDVTVPPPAARCGVLRTLRRGFADIQDIIGETRPGRYAVLHHVPASGDDATVAVARALAVELDRRHGLSCRAAVGPVAGSVPELHDSYRDASNALCHAGTAPVVHARDVMIHDLLATVSPRARLRFTSAVTSALRERPDWAVLRQTIVTTFECGFNLVRASTALHIHRNTLVYRLQKIETISGREIADPQSRLLLYLACLIDDDSTGANERTGAAMFPP